MELLGKHAERLFGAEFARDGSREYGWAVGSSCSRRWGRARVVPATISLVVGGSR
jgi:hypothetical protein